jgi:CheY-like chemotaxis protein
VPWGFNSDKEEGKLMTSESLLKDKMVLVVDDEPDILEIVGEVLSMCLVHKAGDYDTALQYLLSYNYDVVILDIMGVNGFELLKKSVLRGFPTVMLTAHALSPASLKKSIKLGAVSFLPKEKMPELPSYLEEVILRKGQSVWRRLFDELGDFFNKRFGLGWKERDKFFRGFEEEIRKEMESEPPSQGNPQDR